MTADPVTVAEDTPLEDVVTLMEKRRIKRVPVVKDGTVVGIVSRANLLHALASVAGEAAPAKPGEVRLKLAPVYLRRTQKDVLKELPDLQEIDEVIPLEPADRAAYAQAPMHLMQKRLAATVGAGGQQAAKYDRLRELLAQYREEGRKVVLFSFFRQVLDDVGLIAGEHDPNAPPKVMQRMAERIPGSRYVEFSGIGHLMNLEAPDDFDQTLIEFLRETPQHRLH